jgi:hypothetical protein
MPRAADSPARLMGDAPGSVGGQAAAGWLRARAISTPPKTLRWHVEIAMGLEPAPPPIDFDETKTSRFHLDVYSEEWGLFFCHGGKASWIRVTDLAFVHGRDDHELLAIVPPLRDISSLLRELERRHGIHFRRDHAAIRTNLANAEQTIRAWIRSL